MLAKNGYISKVMCILIVWWARVVQVNKFDSKFSQLLLTEREHDKEWEYVCVYTMVTWVCKKGSTIVVCNEGGKRENKSASSLLWSVAIIMHYVYHGLRNKCKTTRHTPCTGTLWPPPQSICENYSCCLFLLFNSSRCRISLKFHCRAFVIFFSLILLYFICCAFAVARSQWQQKERKKEKEVEKYRGENETE